MATARARSGPSLFLRLFLLLLLSLLAAEAINFVFLLLSPPPSLPIHHLEEIRTALATGHNPSGQLRVEIGEPPALAANGPLVEMLQQRLATSLGDKPEDVRLSLVRRWPPGRWFVPNTISLFRHRRHQFMHDFHADLVVGRFVAALRLPDGRWRVVTSSDRGFESWLWQTLLSLLAIVVAVAPPAWLLAHRLTAPIRFFATAAERLGRDPRAPPLPLQGPREVVAATEALNEMQERLRDYIDDRTTMIAAIAHDLRTPLMRLAFRLETAPAEIRAQVEPDIAEMKAMIASALVFARETTAGERQRLDLRSLIESLADSMVDQGQDIVLLPSAEPIVMADSLALRALFGNLLENAVRYGVRARVTLSQEGPWARVDVDDDGPGLGDGEFDRVFEPFYRAEPSRSRATGGTGLGLAIVRAITKAHQGDVFVANRPGGGLRATVLLPRDSKAAVDNLCERRNAPSTNGLSPQPVSRPAL